MNPSATDFTAAETFPGTLTFGVFIRRYLPQLGVIALLVFVLVDLLLHGLGTGGLAVPAAALVACGFAGAVVVLKKRQFDSTWGTAALELSPAGATIVSRYARVHLPWDRIRELGKVDLIVPARHTSGGWITVTLVYSLLALTTRRRGRPALIGSGTTTVAPRTPRYVRGQIQENTGWAINQLQTAIVLAVYEKHWDRGRIGEWIRAYRPDILPWT